MFVSLVLYVLLGMCMYFVFPIAVAGAIQRWDKNSILEPGITDILGYVLAPFLTTLILYYLFLLFPHHSDAFYVSSIVFFFLGIFLLHLTYAKSIMGRWLLVFSIHKPNPSEANDTLSITYAGRNVSVSISKSLLFVALLLIVFSSMYVAKSPLTGHDTLEYAILGKSMGVDKVIHYQQHPYNPSTGFYYVGLHGHSYNLMRTWEFLWGNLFGKPDSDRYFRLLSAYYYLLMFLLGWKLLSQKGIRSLIIWFLLTYLPVGFFAFITNPHVDAYRVCLISISLLLLYHAIDTSNKFIFFLFCIYSGSQAFIHSLGVFIASICFLAFLIFHRESLLMKIKSTLIFVLLFLLMGNIHYLMDVFWGTGWIFKEIKFY
ncbi:MAG: hypothetical protein ACK5CV_09055 [Bacteroidota bacterium]|jgi:hypothetical protein